MSHHRISPGLYIPPQPPMGQLQQFVWLARLMRIRRAVETAIGKLSEMFAAQTTKARDLRGFVNRMARKLLAYNFSPMSPQA